MRRSLAMVSGACILIGWGGVLAPPTAGATTPVQVTTTGDSGPGSLRQALVTAVDGDTITFAPSVTGTINLLSPLTANSNVTVTGPGAATLTIDGGNQVQDLVIGGGSGTVTVSGLTFTHGSGENGGAIQDDAGRGLSLTDVVVSNSTATGNGGGIYLSGPQTLTLIDSTVSGNSAATGGGIYADLPSSGALVVQGSTINGNTATTGQGAGIDAAGRQTVSAGLTKSHGAEGPNAVAPPPPPPPTSVGVAVITTSTIADNTASAANAALFLHRLDVNSRLASDTIADNKATGLTLDSPLTDHPLLAATIVAHNTADCSGSPLVDRGYNIDSDGSCQLSATGSHSHSATIDAALSPLHLNGGPTATIAISGTGDPAHAVVPGIFTVPNGAQPLCVVPDQRGVLPAGAPCDIGAFQREGAPKIKATVHSRTPKTHYGWYGSPVRVSFACHSASTLLTIVCASDVTLDRSGRNRHATGVVTAQDGRTATAEVRLSIDTVPPTVDGVKNGHTYSHAPTITCHDNLSGVASCTVHRHHARGSHWSYAVTATDKAGHKTVSKGDYKLG